MELALIAAVAANGVIGNRGRIPWDLPGDRRHFKEVTLGSAVIMGGNTWDGLPIRPLPNRVNIIMSRNPKRSVHHDCILTGSIEEALRRGGELSERIFFVGGAEIYRLALPYVNRIYLTRVDCEPEGDVFFPAVNWNEWHMTSSEEKFHPANGLHYRFETYERIQEGEKAA